jgi:nicotinamide-nucleotide amidase
MVLWYADSLLILSPPRRILPLPTFPEDVHALAAEVLELARRRGVMIGTAESCTGGLVAGALTSIAGSSDVVEGGLVTYSNAAKSKLLGVDPDLVARHGAVSEPVARAMAQGALSTLGAGLAVAVTGVAGPGGGSAEKPAGLVHVAAAGLGEPADHVELRLGDIGRDEVRMASVATALGMLKARLTR